MQFIHLEQWMEKARILLARDIKRHCFALSLWLSCHGFNMELCPTHFCIENLIIH